MSVKKTLGGDRLGAGKKMQVELNNYERSTHDLGYLWRSTMSSGTLVPFMSQLALPGDTWDIDLNFVGMTHPTSGPLFGGYKVQLDVFIAPIRLYIGALHNNKLGVGNQMQNVKLPKFQMLPARSSSDPANGVPVPSDVANSQINPSSLLKYLGLSGVGIRALANTTELSPRRFNAVSLLMYWDTYKNYYANKQEEIGAVIHTAVPAVSEDVIGIDVDGMGLGFEVTTNQPVVSPGSFMALTLTAGTQDYKQVYIEYVGPDGNNVALPLTKMFYLVDGSNPVLPVFEFNPNSVPGGAGGITLDFWRYINAADIEEIPIDVVTFPLENIDIMRENILGYANQPTEFVINAGPYNIAPYSYLFEVGAGDRRSILNSQEGLACKTYQSDLFNNWLSTEWIDGTNGISEMTAIDTSGGSFTVDQMVLAKKMYDLLNRIAVSGGSYDDWIEAVYTGVKYTRAESPIYCGGLIKELVFQEVVSNAQSGTSADVASDDMKPLGSLAGKGVMGKKHKGGSVTIKVDEPSYIMGIVSLTPRIDYSTGNQWDLNLSTMDDLHKPGLDEIGFEELITENMAWWDTWQNEVSNVWETKSAGKQPAWIKYMTNVNKVYGNFAIEDSEMFMVLNRRYMAEPSNDKWTIGDLTTYIDPRKFNFIFADTSLDSQNFWAQISVDASVRRMISARLMPNL